MQMVMLGHQKTTRKVLSLCSNPLLQLLSPLHALGVDEDCPELLDDEDADAWSCLME